MRIRSGSRRSQLIIYTLVDIIYELGFWLANVIHKSNIDKIQIKCIILHYLECCKLNGMNENSEEYPITQINIWNMSQIKLTMRITCMYGTTHGIWLYDSDKYWERKTKLAKIQLTEKDKQQLFSCSVVQLLIVWSLFSGGPMKRTWTRSIVKLIIKSHFLKKLLFSDAPDWLPFTEYK